MQDLAQRWKTHVQTGQSSQQGVASLVRKTGSSRAHWVPNRAKISAQMEIETPESWEPGGDGAGRQNPGDRVNFSVNEVMLLPPPRGQSFQIDTKTP